MLKYFRLKIYNQNIFYVKDFVFLNLSAYMLRGDKHEEFRRFGGDYLTQFLNPAIEAGIIIKTGNQKSARYKVNN